MAPVGRLAGAFVALLLLPVLVFAQDSAKMNSTAPQHDDLLQPPSELAFSARVRTPEPHQSDTPTNASSGDKSENKKQKENKQLPAAPAPSQNSSPLQQTNRMMWIVPNFAAVSPGVKFKPMTPKQKLWMATEDSFDYSSFVWSGVLAAQSYALDQYPELGTGGVAYGRYYWRGVLDGISNPYFSEAIVPILTHQDPRYFTLGHGGFFPRLAYALTRVVVTYSDSGRNTFNISEVGGDFASSALSTAYYPPQERGMVKITEGWGTQLESAALNNIAKEFWPDVRKLLLHKH